MAPTQPAAAAPPADGCGAAPAQHVRGRAPEHERLEGLGVHGPDRADGAHHLAVRHDPEHAGGQVLRRVLRHAVVEVEIVADAVEALARQHLPEPAPVRGGVRFVAGVHVRPLPGLRGAFASFEWPWAWMRLKGIAIGIPYAGMVVTNSACLGIDRM